MNKILKQIVAITLLLTLTINCQSQQKMMQTISKNRVNVHWHYQGDRIYFEMSAPTDGWVTIGFNQSTGIQGAYLLMGNVINGQTNLVEHYTLSAGNYQPIKKLNGQVQVKDIEGVEKGNKTTIKFSLPILAASKYQKDLSKGSEYVMILAYSQADDFQHHSMMRTSMKVKL